MTTPKPMACRSCGAALTPGAVQCDLCGTPVHEATPPAPELSPDVSLSPVPLPSGLPPGSRTTQYCTACGHENPIDARFCNACGTALPASVVAPARPPVPASSGERPPSDVGKRAMVFVGGALGMVVALYALTAFLGDRSAPVETPAEPTAATAGTAAAVPLPPGDTPPLPGPTAQSEADAFEAQNTPDGFYEAARYYLTASYENQEGQPEASRQWAHEAVGLLERSLELDENPDVRIALAEAAAFEGVDPMRPVQEAQAVLTVDPTHPGANLFIGQRRLMIGRVEAAREAFEIVVENSEPGDPARESAESALAMIASQTVPGAE